MASASIIIGSHKSVFLAFLLALFFGPFGLLYATVAGGVVMLIVAAVFGLLTAGLGLILTWPIGIVWAMVAVVAHNSRLSSLARSQATMEYHSRAADRPIAERVA